MHMKSIAALLALLFVFAGCGAQEQAAPPAASATGTAPAAAASVPPPAPASDMFKVEVKLSPAAAAKLASIKETIIVGADFSGEPAPGAPEAAEPGAGVELGRQTVELLEAGQAVFALGSINPARLERVKDRDVRVLIDRKSTRLNSSHERLSRMPSSA